MRASDKVHDVVLTHGQRKALIAGLKRLEKTAAEGARILASIGDDAAQHRLFNLERLDVIRRMNVAISELRSVEARLNRARSVAAQVGLFHGESSALSAGDHS